MADTAFVNVCDFYIYLCSGRPSAPWTGQIFVTEEEPGGKSDVFLRYYYQCFVRRVAFVIDGVVHIRMFWEEHSELAEDHRVTYIVRESLFLKSFREVYLTYSKLHVCKIYNLINFTGVFTYETITMIKIVKISIALRISSDAFVISRPSLTCFLSL